MNVREFILRWERWIVGLVMGAVLGTGYYSLDLYLSRASALHIHEFSIPLDASIPIVPWTIWVYSLYYPFCFIVIPLLTTRERFFRVALAFFLEFGLAFVFFILFPSRIIRPEVISNGFSGQVLIWFYNIDPGYNIFPSLHVANSVLVAWVFFYYGSRWAWPAAITAALISASTVLVKAHYVLDIPGGIILAMASIALAWIGVKEPREVRARVSSAGALLLLLLSPITARANPMDHYGLGSRGGGMANANVAVADDWTAPYYNPAGMTRTRETFGFGLLGVASGYVSIKPMGTGKPTNSFEQVEGFYLGITHSLGTKNLRGGLTVYLPLQRYQMARTYFIDEREALPGMSNRLHFEFYGEREQGQVLLPALAYRFAPWLSFGLGVSILNDTTANTSVYEPDPSNPSNSIINVSNNTIYTYAPIFGLLSELPGDVAFGAAYRGEIAFPIHGQTTIILNNPPNPFGADLGPDYRVKPMYLDFLVNYTPAMASLGASYQGIAGVLLTGELQWAGWSRYKDTHNTYPSPRLKDVFSPRVAAESRYDPWVFRAGYGYEPSPVPHQGGRTNIVDNDSHILTLGTARNFGLRGHGARAGVFVQARYLVPRRETKEPIDPSDSNAPRDALPYQPKWPVTWGVQNPGYPGWESGGWVFAAGIDISLAL